MKRLYNQFPFNLSNANEDRLHKSKPQCGKGGGSQCEKTICAKYGKKHVVKFLVVMDNCFSCGKHGHMVRDCPMTKTQQRESNQEQASGHNYNAPKKNCFYALKSRGDQEDSLDVVYQYVSSIFN